jgi:hypothetical protein
MPLVSAILASALEGIGFPSGSGAAKSAWADAWASYAAGSTCATSVTASSFAAAFSPLGEDQSADDFCTALEAAMLAGWNAAIFKPLYTAPVASVSPLSATLKSVLEGNRDLTVAGAAAAKIANAIDAWTVTCTVTLTAGGTQPLA